MPTRTSFGPLHSVPHPRLTRIPQPATFPSATRLEVPRRGTDPNEESTEKDRIA
ncbi:hypothetical protein ACRALDRAFT_212092 [Sodiomyces alcalophilus JCM 7366]|uniref:uncharacterized protein n=1 Tax=Sodiomyces alcalophilus JCM 7366 TaxID=591952 RepID=UPI0039B5E402